MKDREEELVAALKEHQARQEWAAQQQLIGQIRDELLLLPLEARAKLLQEFCCACGREDPNCKCTWSDEELEGL